jgi:hypothetical protein
MPALAVAVALGAGTGAVAAALPAQAAKSCGAYYTADGLGAFARCTGYTDHFSYITVTVLCRRAFNGANYTVDGATVTRKDGISEAWCSSGDLRTGKEYTLQ